MKYIHTQANMVNGQYHGPWCIENGSLEYIGPYEHYLHETIHGDYEIYATSPILNELGKIQFNKQSVIMRKYKLILISYDKGSSWRYLND